MIFVKNRHTGKRVITREENLAPRGLLEARETEIPALHGMKIALTTPVLGE